MVSTWFHHQDPPPLVFGVWTFGRRFNGASGRRVCVCVQQDSVPVDGGLYRKLRAHFVSIAFTPLRSVDDCDLRADLWGPCLEHCRCSSPDKWSRKVFCLLPALTSLYNPLSIASLLHCFIASLLRLLSGETSFGLFLEYVEDLLYRPRDLHSPFKF